MNLVVNTTYILYLPNYMLGDLLIGCVVLIRSVGTADGCLCSC